MINYSSDDSEKYIDKITNIINGVTNAYHPEIVYIIKIDNWFGNKWAWFGGKVLGALGIHSFQKLVIPPFSPNRISEQQYFKFDKNSDTYIKKQSDPLHIYQTSSNNFHRVIKKNYDSAVFAWFSGNSEMNKKGSIMIYWVKDKMAWGWHAYLALKDRWIITKTKWAPRNEILNFEDSGKNVNYF